MDDDVFFIPDSISIMSKIKDPIDNRDNELSRIIRQEGIDYNHEINVDEWNFNHKNFQEKVHKTDRKDRSPYQIRHNPQINTYNYQEREFKHQYKTDVLQKRGEKSKKQPGVEYRNIKNNDMRVNLIIFEENEKESKNINNSKKQKRVQKAVFDEQKTKKIEFQDIDRYKKQLRKEQATKIRHNQQIENVVQNNIGLESYQISENLIDSRDISILTHKVVSNCKIIASQLKQQMGMLRYMYTQTQKIDVRKLISKFQGEIRRIKISFRGLSDSTGKNSSGLSASKLRIHEDNRQRRGQVSTSKVQSRIKKDKPVENYKKYGFDYGLLDQQNGEQDLQNKLQRLQEIYRNQVTRQNRFVIKLNELDRKCNLLRMNNNRMDESLLRRQHQVGGSIIKRSKILKQKISFLHNQLKQSKKFYSNKIKRLKNQINILNNENVYIQKQIEQIRKVVKQRNKNDKKIVSDNNIKRQNIYIFEDIQSTQINNNQLAHQSTKNLNSNIGSINQLKSFQSIDSVKSTNYFASKPSLGSLGSYKSNQGQVQVQQKRRLIDQNPIKNRLKINSPHHSPPSMGDLKHSSFLRRLNNENENRKELNHIKKSTTSLDVAIKQLQQKYSRHLRNEDEYYQ